MNFIILVNGCEQGRVACKETAIARAIATPANNNDLVEIAEIIGTIGKTFVVSPHRIPENTGDDEPGETTFVNRHTP